MSVGKYLALSVGLRLTDGNSSRQVYFFKFSFSSTINITDNGSGRGGASNLTGVGRMGANVDWGECGLGRCGGNPVLGL